MNVEQVKEWIAAGELAAVESAWLEAVEAKAPTGEMVAVLEALVAAGKTDTAETCAAMLLEEREGQLAPNEALEVAKGAVLAVPTSDELRVRAADLYRKVHGGQKRFEAIFQASGLLSGQSPRRALRTLDTCLPLKDGSYLANRFDNQVVRVVRYDETFEDYQIVDAAGRASRAEPKNLADEFDPVADDDFRVFCQHRSEELGKLIQSDPAPVLIGICQTAGGRIDSVALKEMLVPKYIPADQWGDWWGRARTAAKRCPQLSLEGRSPFLLSYHRHGRTLEEELSGAVEAAKTPLERLAVIQQYLREVRARKLGIRPEFVAPVMAALAEQAGSFQHKRPADALAAALAIDAVVALGLPAPAAGEGRPTCPSAAEVLASAEKPAEVLAELGEASLLPAALDALNSRADAAVQLEALLSLVPAGQLDEVAGRLEARGGQEAIARAAAKAAASPGENLELFLWLWRGPVHPPANLPGKVELLSRLLNTVLGLDHDWSVNPAKAKAVRQRIRSVLSAADYAAYRQAIGEMNEAVAGTIKRLIERTEGLAEAVRDDMLNILRENFFALFAKARTEPWLDEGATWTTEATLHRRQAELKELEEVQMLANAKAIGAAAAHGDLSENSEWRFALEERDMLRARAAKTREELVKARVLRPENVPADAVGIGSRVVLKRVSDGAEREIAFLGPWDVDLDRNIYSYQTPVALDLMGHGLGETLILKIDQEEAEYRIERLSSALG